MSTLDTILLDLEPSGFSLGGTSALSSPPSTLAGPPERKKHPARNAKPRHARAPSPSFQMNFHLRAVKLTSIFHQKNLSLPWQVRISGGITCI